jgi:hypothetical protein|tara:strand:- start:2364 stop:2756 length:393 start_codon:yes stop_codon:yes gene_type:complete
MSKRKSKNYTKFAKTVIQKLEKEGVESYLWHAATTGSAYIRFNDNRIGSIRLGDHKGRSQYSYKWNIRSDFPTGHSKWHKVDGRWRYYVHSGNWGEIIPHIVETKKEVDKMGPSKYGGYYIPKHKEKKHV